MSGQTSGNRALPVGLNRQLSWRCSAALALAALVGAAPACQSESSGNGNQFSNSPGGSNVLIPAEPDAGKQVDYTLVASISILASPNLVQAGYPVALGCVVLDENGDPVEGAQARFEVVSSAGPSQIDEVIGEETEGISEATATFEAVGPAVVACHLPDRPDLGDATEAIEVIAGDPTVVETSIEPSTITAGEKTTATCEIWDAFGNAVNSSAAGVAVGADEGWVAQGMVVKIAKAGVFDVWCHAGDAVDETPPQVTVEPGIPTKIVTRLEPDIIQAGDQSELSCEATDSYYNPVPGFPISIVKPGALSLDGKTLTGFVSGLYELKCVPATDPWEWYSIEPDTLTVESAPPAEIFVQLIPPKPVYQKNDTVEMAISVLDVFGNVVPEATLEPIVIQPEEGVGQLSDTSFRFLEEGIYNFGIVVTDYPEVFTGVEILVDGTGPLIAIEYPPRGATLSGKPSVTVEGFVDDDIAGLVSFSINDEAVSVKPDGTFSHILIPQQGMNIIVAEALDVGGQVTRTSRSFFYSSKWYEVDTGTPEDALVEDGVVFWLGQGFLDDGVHDPADPDDMATVILNIVDGIDLASSIPSPAAEFSLIGSWTYKLFINGINYNAPTLELDAFEGGIETDVGIANFKIDVKLAGSCKILFFDVCPDFSGSVRADAILIAADLLAAVVGGEPNISVASTNVSMPGLDLDINGILGELFDFFIDWILGFFTDEIEGAFEDELGGVAADLLGEVLTILALDSALEIPPLLGDSDPVTLAVNTELTKLDFAEPGGLVGLGGRVTTPKKVPQKPLGSIGRAGCLITEEPPYAPPTSSEFAIALHDDFLNQVLYSVWSSGLLNVALDSDTLGDVSELAEFGVDYVDIDTFFFAAPMMTSCNPAQQIFAQMGDIFIQVSTAILNVPLEVGIFISLEAEADVLLTTNPASGDKEIGIVLGEVTRREVEVVSISQGFEGSIDWLTTLVEEDLVDGLVAEIGGQALPAFPVPELDLSELDPSLPPGTALEIELDELKRWGGYTAIEGMID